MIPYILFIIINLLVRLLGTGPLKAHSPIKSAGESSLSVMNWQFVQGVCLPSTQCMLGEAQGHFLTMSLFL